MAWIHDHYRLCCLFCKRPLGIARVDGPPGRVVCGAEECVLELWKARDHEHKGEACDCRNGEPVIG